jgi:protein-S-isoprenylcysteine O-methyltransferase Ste14
MPVDAAGTTPWQWAVGVMLIVAGAVLFGWAIGLFLAVRTGIMPNQASARLVTAGPYRHSRNPQFLAFSSMYIGLALILNVVWPLLLLPGVIVITNLTVIRHEERYLARTFGGTYDDYRRQVPRWL